MPNQVPTGPLTPLGVCMRSVEGHEKKILSHFFYQKCNASERQISNYLKHCMPRNDSFGAKSHTAWRRSRAVLCAVPCATMQKHQTKCTASWIGTFLQPFQMDAAEKKTEVSGIVYSFEFIPMAFFAISHVFFRNRTTSAFAINYLFLSQLNYTLHSQQVLSCVFYHFEYRWLSLRMTFCWVECAATYLTMQSRHRYGMGSTNLTRPNAFWSSTTLWTEPYGNVMADIQTCHILPCQITYLFASSTELDNRGPALQLKSCIAFCRGRFQTKCTWLKTPNQIGQQNVANHFFALIYTYIGIFSVVTCLVLGCKEQFLLWVAVDAGTTAFLAALTALDPWRNSWKPLDFLKKYGKATRWNTKKCWTGTVLNCLVANPMHWSGAAKTTKPSPTRIGFLVDHEN